MIDYQQLDEFIKTIKVNPYGRSSYWKKDLNINASTPKDEIIKKAVLLSCSNFNYWENEGKIDWRPEWTSEVWLNIIMGNASIEDLNLVERRKKYLDQTKRFLKYPLLPEHKDWWVELSKVFGNDPLRKREVLTYMVLDDLGFKNLYCPNVGCIDYNVMLVFRYYGIIQGFEGNIFNEKEETQIRTECLAAIMYIFQHGSDMTISQLDEFLFKTGRYLRKNTIDWEQHFSYKFGCYYY